MIELLLRLALRHRWFVIATAVAVLIVGGYRAAQMPIDVFPDLTAPRVTVVTESTGMASEEVERLITFEVESAINGTAGLRRVRSASAPGISVVWAEFDWDTSQTVARQRVTERLQTVAGTLPPEASAPLLAPASSVMGEIAFVAVSSETASPMELRRAAEVTVRRSLLAVRGVSQVVPIGGDVKQYQVLVDPLRLEQYELSLSELSDAVELGTRNASGGYVVDGGQESVIRVLGRAHSASDLGLIVANTRDGLPVRIRDVATIVEGPALARGAASFNATAAVMISIVKQPNADTVSTTQRLDDRLDELEAQLAGRGIELHREVFRQKDFIDTAITNLATVLRDGAVLVVVVLLVFLWSLRPTLISVVSIPLSLVTALLVLDLLGMTIDTMTLGGLAIAVGVLVDDAIVDVENVGRRLRERSALAVKERPAVVATVLSASLEIRSAITSATLILGLVFVPLLLLDGLEGRLLRPLAFSYLVAIAASLVVAVTVTPVLCSFLLARPRDTKRQREPRVIAFLNRVYKPVLRISVARPWLVIGLVVGVVGAGSYGFTHLGRSFLPPFNEGSLTINMVLAPGTSLRESDALATLAERALLEDEYVLSVGRRTGRAERDEHVLGIETTEMEVRVSAEDPRTREQLFADIRERLEIVPASFTLGQPISHRIEHMISGQRSALSIKIFGEDLRVLRRVANRVKDSISTIRGVVDLNVEQIVDIPQLIIRVDASRAASYGLSTGAAAREIGTALWGRVPARIYEEGTSVDVVVRYAHGLDRGLDDVDRIRVPTPGGALVPISALAEVRRDSGPNYILRENVSRRVVVTANIAAGDVGGVVAAVEERVDTAVDIPDGVRVEFGGQFEREQATSRRLFLFGTLAVLGIIFIVGATLGSVRRTLIVAINMPLALAGGVVGVFFAGGVLSVATMIGFITLFGIATRNGILLATRARDLELENGDRHAAVLAAATERLAPILMTAVTAALGLLPLAFALGQPGSEIQAPMALVILTGLVTSTLLNMIVVPALLYHWGGPATHSTTSEAGA